MPVLPMVLKFIFKNAVGMIISKGISWAGHRIKNAFKAKCEGQSND